MGPPDRIDGRLSTQAACPPTSGGFMRCTGMFGSGASPPPRVSRLHLRMTMATYQLLCAGAHGRTTRTTAGLHHGSREPRIIRVKPLDFEWRGAFRTTTATAPEPPRRRSRCRYRLHASRCPQSALLGCTYICEGILPRLVQRRRPRRPHMWQQEASGAGALLRLGGRGSHAPGTRAPQAALARTKTSQPD